MDWTPPNRNSFLALQIFHEFYVLSHIFHISHCREGLFKVNRLFLRETIPDTRPILKTGHFYFFPNLSVRWRQRRKLTCWSCFWPPCSFLIAKKEKKSCGRALAKTSFFLPSNQLLRNGVKGKKEPLSHLTFGQLCQCKIRRCSLLAASAVLRLSMSCSKYGQINQYMHLLSS